MRVVVSLCLHNSFPSLRPEHTQWHAADNILAGITRWSWTLTINTLLDVDYPDNILAFAVNQGVPGS